MEWNLERHNPTITKRGVLYVTKRCNLNCCFCYYKFLDHRPVNSLQDIEVTIEMFKNEYKLEHVDITGGEPTIHPKIREIVSLCREYGISPTVITNGVETDLILELIEIGIEDLLISIHGIGKNHDEAVGREGAFKKLERTISCLLKRGFTCRTNSVLTCYCCNEMNDLANYLATISPRIVNLISFNPHSYSQWKDKNIIPFQVSYKVQSEAVKKAIEILDKKGIWVNARYIPFCFLKGLEKHVCNFRQLPYDPYEWEFTSSNRMTRTEINKKTSEAIENQVFGNSKEQMLYNYLMQEFTHQNARVQACHSCTIEGICDHIYHQYLAEFGDDGYLPYGGDPIIDPMHFRNQDHRWAVLKGIQ